MHIKKRYGIIVGSFAACLLLAGGGTLGLWLVNKAHSKLAAFDQKLNTVIHNTAYEHDHRYARMFVMRSQLEEIASDYVAIVGDSITEATSRRSACNRPLFNAGVAGATVAAINRDTLPLLQRHPPLAMLLAIGVNDAKRASTKTAPERLAEFELDYRALLSTAKAITTHVGVATIAPVEKGKILGDTSFDSGLIQQFNTIIRHVAGDMSIAVTELADLADEQGLAREGSTSDGVHLAPQAYRQWWAAMERGWSTIIKDCRAS